MRKHGEEFFKVFASILCAMILCIGFYNLYINLFHQNYLNQEIRISELDKNYIEYKDNVEQISKNLSKSKLSNDNYDLSTMENLYNGVKTCLNYLKKHDGVYSLKVGQSLKPYDIYRLNADFNNELYNYCWISGMGFVNIESHSYTGYLGDVFPNYDRTIKVLVDNSDYVRKELLGNSSYHYRTSITKNVVRNDFMEQYDMVLYNYKVFSDIIVEISDFLVRGDY